LKKGIDLAFYEKKADVKNYVYFNKVVCNDKVAFYPHFHDSIELVLCVKGQCCVCINGIENLLEEGDGVFIDRFDVHFYRYFPESEYYVLLISEKYLDDDNGFNKKRLPEFLPKCEKYKDIERLLDNLYELFDKESDVIKKGVANTVLGIFSNCYPQVDRKHNGEARLLVDALMYINENYRDEITLDEVSRKLGYSKNYFSFLFNKFTGMNLREYINSRRVNEFERLKAANPSVPTYVLAEESGFSNSKTFYRAYKKYKEKS